MDHILQLFSEECCHNEKFKENFACLQKEYVKVCCENEQLKEELVKSQKNSDQPLTQLQTKLRNLEVEIKEKERTVTFLQTKLDVAERVIREQEAQEEQLLSRITSTELTLEETNSLLSSLQGESKILVSQIEEFYQGIVQKYEAEKQSIIHELTQKCLKSENEKREIAQKVLSATEKTSRNISHLKNENSLFKHAGEKLQKALKAASAEQTELAAQLIALKVTHEQEQAELISQSRNLQCELVKVQAKAETSEKSLLGILEEKNRDNVQLSVLQNENSNLKNRLFENETLHRKELEKLRKDVEQTHFKYNTEKEELLRANNDVKHQLDVELTNITQLSEKLRAQELALASEQEHLRKMETESIKKVHNTRIKTEDKYRAIVEEKLRLELDLTRKISELESHLILERNLKSNIESQMQKLSTENVNLNEQCKAESDMHDKVLRLERELSKKEEECVRLTQDLERCKQNFNQTNDSLRKEKESLLARCANLEDQIFQEKKLVQEEIRKTQSLAVQKEEESRKKIDEMQKSLREIQQKSRQYAKLIWKLRHRLVEQEGKYSSGILNTPQLPTNSTQPDKHFPQSS